VLVARIFAFSLHLKPHVQSLRFSGPCLLADGRKEEKGDVRKSRATFVGRHRIKGGGSRSCLSRSSRLFFHQDENTTRPKLLVTRFNHASLLNALCVQERSPRRRHSEPTAKRRKLDQRTVCYSGTERHGHLTEMLSMQTH